MCPKFKREICEMVDTVPNNVGCVRRDHCLGEEWGDCHVYISQFFFDADDRFVLDGEA
jgi:hypothetical protein